MKVRHFFSVAVVLAILLAAGTVGAAPATGSEDWRFHDIVDANFVKQHVTIPMDEDVMIIDSRPKRAKYDKGHIPMAVSIPDSSFDKMIDQLPKNKNALLVFYCQGLK